MDVNVQQTVADVEALGPYWYHIASFFWLLLTYRAVNSIKRYQHFPAFLCKEKTSKNGLFRYKKLRVKYIRVISVLLAFAGLIMCQKQLLGVVYPGVEQLIVICTIAAMSSQIIIDLVIARIRKSDPESADILANGLYKQCDDMTMVDATVIALVTGGGIDKRAPPDEDITETTRVLTPDELAEITKPNE